MGYFQPPVALRNMLGPCFPGTGSGVWMRVEEFGGLGSLMSCLAGDDEEFEAARKSGSHRLRRIHIRGCDVDLAT